MDMIEKVARALCVSADENWDAATFSETLNGDDPAGMRAYWLSLARAAIEATKKPTEAMLHAGMWSIVSNDERTNEEIVLDCYTAMIDSALGEKVG
ncbi:hypothetical protein UFOVP1672_40 [uncultured Caudovirales phage]|uniref:Uncharacterized protein n=1 Tax=uncultured Caudovirales phage TaxID=2100421 RepID=A0A6J5T8E1_9CAUD|nr:hypothetical protein UFOVP988_62 [uncultured Caudovirales phage]CAB4211013.1 hypothetical protein UFOVP1425_62 [uncultured Caudovirales phage]CAB4223406.1 hypothetical protein UFOVP1672_40 [uncultured Caudovirales phage]